jgi:NAD+ kinase
MPRSSEAVRRIAVVSYGDPKVITEACARVEAIAAAAGAEVVESDDVDLAVVLGGDGTTLRALHQFLGTSVPVIGVNFGRVGFLSAMTPDTMEDGLARAFAGERRVVELPTLDLDLDGTTTCAINDVVCATSTIGRMVELAWAVGGEDLGVQPCDGVICASATGSTAYNLSSGGPVLVWGLDALAVTFIAPHSLHARSMVVPRGLDVVVANATPDVPATVLADGQHVGEIPPEGRVAVRLGEERTLLATLPEVTFFRRYRNTFTA